MINETLFGTVNALSKLGVCALNSHAPVTCYAGASGPNAPFTPRPKPDFPHPKSSTQHEACVDKVPNNKTVYKEKPLSTISSKLHSFNKNEQQCSSREQAGMGNDAAASGVNLEESIADVQSSKARPATEV